VEQQLSWQIRPYRPGEEEYVAQAHKRIYPEEFGWGDNFTNYAMQVAYDFAAAPRPHSQMWVAEVQGRPVGSIILLEAEPKVGQLRLFLVVPEFRGTGVASALIDRAMEQAREWGFCHLFLWTADGCLAARHKYARLGFVMTDHKPANGWAIDGSPVEEERWDLPLI